jgi:hypothetical protein
MFGHANAVRVGDLCNRNPSGDGRVKICVEPMPAVIANFRLGALLMRSAVKYAGQKGCEMTTSALTSSRSNSEEGPCLSP